MTLTDISNASQAVAAVAVVASLIILILQNRQANALARDEAMRRQSDGIKDISRMIVETPGLAAVWTRGVLDFEQLSNEERVRFVAFVAYTNRIWEALHKQHLRGQLDDELWQAHARMLRDVQSLSGVKRAWGLRKHVFSEAFQDFYEANAAPSAALDLYGLDLSDEQRTSGAAPD